MLFGKKKSEDEKVNAKISEDNQRFQDEHLRAECLRIAASRENKPISGLIESADQMFEFIKGNYKK